MNSLKLNIKIVQDISWERAKWIVWEKNIGKKYFTNLVSFSEGTVLWALSNKTHAEGLIRRIKEEENTQIEEDWRNKSRIRKNDLVREFTIQEYMNLSRILKKADYKYNKRKISFIKLN